MSYYRPQIIQLKAHTNGSQTSKSQAAHAPNPGPLLISSALPSHVLRAMHQVTTASPSLHP